MRKFKDIVDTIKQLIKNGDNMSLVNKKIALRVIDGVQPAISSYGISLTTIKSHVITGKCVHEGVNIITIIKDGKKQTFEKGAAIGCVEFIEVI